jgi:hypothetical protein
MARQVLRMPRGIAAWRTPVCQAVASRPRTAVPDIDQAMPFVVQEA